MYMRSSLVAVPEDVSYATPATRKLPSHTQAETYVSHSGRLASVSHSPVSMLKRSKVLKAKFELPADTGVSRR